MNNVSNFYFRGMSMRLLFLLMLIGLFTACDQRSRSVGPTVAERAKVDSLEKRISYYFGHADTLSYRILVDSLYVNADPDENRYQRYKALRLKAMLLQDTYRYEELVPVIEEMLQLSEGVPGMKEEYVHALYRKSDNAFNMRQYQTAFQSIFKAKKVVGTLDSCNSAYYDYRLGMVTYRQKDFARSKEYFERSLPGFMRCEPSEFNILRIQEVMSNIGLCEVNMGNYDAAYDWYERAFRYLQQKQNYLANNPRMMAIAQAVLKGNQGVVLAKQGYIELAQVAIEEEIKVNLEPTRDRMHLVSTVNELLESFYEASRIVEMRPYLEMLDTLPELRSDIYPAGRYYFHKTNFHAKNGEHALAMLYVDSFTATYEKLRLADRELYRTDIERSMRVMESEYQIKELQQQSLVNRQRSFFVILLVLVLLLLGLLSAFSWFKLRKNNEELVRLNREKDKVLRVVAHDLRNPVAAIYSISEMEIESAPAQAEKDAWLMVRKACSGALELIREMLDVTSIQNSKTPKPQLIAVNLLLQDAIQLIQHRATEKEIKIHFEGLSIPKCIHVAIDPMLRVIVNLLSNAIKFSENGKTIHMKAELNEAGLLITVVDEGIGIPQAVQGKVFDSFTTARRSGTAGEAAFGLGLSIVKEIVERHNGKVWFISREGEGSTFYIQLPTQLLNSSQEGLPDEAAS